MTKVSAEWVTQREGGSDVLLRFMRVVALNAPRWVTDPLIWLISLTYAVGPGRPTNRASMDYLGRVFGRNPTFRDRHRHVRTFAHVMLDRARLLMNGSAEFTLEASGQEIVESLHEEGRGAVLLGAHFGSFEALRAYDRALPGLRVRYMMYREHAGKETAIADRMNPEVTARIISLARGEEAMLAAYEALARGEFVAFLGDRLPHTAAKAQVAVPFLGGTIWVPVSPYAAAFAARVPLIFCTAPRLGNRRYAAQFTLLHDGSPVPRSLRQATMETLATRYAELLEGLCRKYPYNWLNFFDIWGGRDALCDADAGERDGRP